MSLHDVAVGGAIGVAGSLSVTLLSAWREARGRERAHTAVLGVVVVYVVDLARTAQTANFFMRKAARQEAEHFVAEFREQRRPLLEAWENLLVSGSRRAIVAAGALMTAVEAVLKNAVASKPVSNLELERMIDVIQNARARMLAPRRFAIRRRRTIRSAIHR